MRDERQRKLAEFHSPEAKDDRRIEREELRKKRQRRKEKKAAYELEQKRKRIEAISRQTALEMDFARDEELARVRARQSEPAPPSHPEPVLSNAEMPADERNRRTDNSILDTRDSPDCYYEPLSPEDQALFDYQVRLESGDFKEGDTPDSVRGELVEHPPRQRARNTPPPLSEYAGPPHPKASPFCPTPWPALSTTQPPAAHNLAPSAFCAFCGYSVPAPLARKALRVPQT